MGLCSGDSAIAEGARRGLPWPIQTNPIAITEGGREQPRNHNISSAKQAPGTRPASNKLNPTTVPIMGCSTTRDLELTGPDQLWVSDISYLRLARGGFVYLATVMDAWSRRIVGWEVMDSIDTRLPLSALHKALDTRQVQPGWVHHSDRGSQYASNAYGDAVTAAGGRRSMSRKGHPGDNSKAESFFATLKCEHVYRTEYEDLADAREQVAAFMERYNRIRRHSALGYVSPERFEAAGAGAGHTGGEDRRRSRSEGASLAHRGQPHRDHRREARSPDEPHHQLGQACTSTSGRDPTN